MSNKQQFKTEVFGIKKYSSLFHFQKHAVFFGVYGVYVCVCI